MMSQRRAMILTPDGSPLYPDATRAQIRGERHPDLGSPASVDLSDIPNADARSPLTLVIQQRCDLGEWHQLGATVVLPNWADNAWIEQTAAGS